MKPLILSGRSLEDLEAILTYISRDKPLAALNFVNELRQQCDFLPTAPQIGERRDDLAPGLRLITFRGYGIYYRELEDQLRVERVLHPSLDVGQQHF